MRDILDADDAQVAAVIAVIDDLNADILVIQGFDHDYDLVALKAFNTHLNRPYEYLFSPPQNRGIPSGHDLDGNGTIDVVRDAFGYGEFAGQSGMAVLSRFSIDTGGVQDFSEFLWIDLPDANIPVAGADPILSQPALSVMRLSTTAHWVVPIQLTGETTINLLTWHATPPVFDGPEDLNGKRGGDEALFWVHYLNENPQTSPAIVIGDANIDPLRGEGEHEAIIKLLGHPRLVDPHPDTSSVLWSSLGEMRVSYVLPESTITLVDAGIVSDHEKVPPASPHYPVWIDISVP